MNTGFNLLGQFDEELSQLHDGSLEGGQPSFDLVNFQNEEKVGFDNDSGLFHTKNQNSGDRRILDLQPVSEG